MSKLIGTWNLTSSENWEEYMKEVGVGMIMRKTAASIKPTVTIENNGSNWNIKLASTFKSSELPFVDGVQFEESNLF